MADDKLTWIDLETEGFNPFSCSPLEVGIIITDLQLESIAERSWIVLPYRTWTKNELKLANPFVYDMHESSGLLDEVETRGVLAGVVDLEVRDWLHSNGVAFDKSDPICGSSIHFDRKFIEKYFPNTNAGFSHRHIDVSTEKEVNRRYSPSVYEEWSAISGRTPKAHRALDDIRNSIAEFRFYRENRGDL